MTDRIQFELVSPEAKLVEEPVKLAVLPGEMGEFGVGARHAALVAHLDPGVVKLYANDKKDDPHRIFITGGFADVTNESCVVLAEEAVRVSDLDQAALQKELKTLQGDLQSAEEIADKSLFQAQIDIVQAKLDAIAA